VENVKVIGIIPARYASSRFPGKPLARINGKPMIQRVYERASCSSRLDGVVVATDDERIKESVTGFKGEVVMTAKTCETGMDRCAEVASSIDCEVVVDIQGDEPLLEPDLLDQLVDSLNSSTWASIVTPIRKCVTAREYQDPDCVKVVVDPYGRVLYFSRSPIPYSQGKYPDTAFIHIGIYAFRRESLLQLGKTPPSRLEKMESLEQLRVLESGLVIKGMLCEGTFIGVDRPEDVERVEKIMQLKEGNK
jgi:3-deoxy-manno-octulosonate cytidylyltransferase (CMP-KDO synthetase)